VGRVVGGLFFRGAKMFVGLAAIHPCFKQHRTVHKGLSCRRIVALPIKTYKPYARWDRKVVMGRSFMASFINSSQMGAATLPPVSPSPKGSWSSRPTHTPVKSSGV